MKIIHTSDWHIGKIVNEFSILEDQKYILDELIKLVDKERPDVLIIAGDMYDRSIPPVDGVELLNNILSKLVMEKGIKVLAISGNHDSGERVCFASNILEKQGLYIVGRDEELYRKIEIDDEYGKVNFYLIPYKDPSVIKKLLDNSEIRNHNDAMKAVVENINKNIDKSDRNILVAHGYVTMYREEAKESSEDKYEAANLEVSESERPLSIGGTDLIDCNIFNDFDYVALGHLHGRQKIGREEVRYSGSLLKYSFSEVNQKKGVTIFDIDKDKNVTLDLRELKPIRDLRIIKGNIDELIEIGRSVVDGREDYIQAILLDEGELINPIEKLRAVYPNVMLITREKKREHDENSTSAKKGYKNKSEKDLFEEFYNALSDGEFTEEKSKIIDETINKILKEEV
ncbi:exonuclease SbcCD subunit D [Clostridium sardiniense]|uniref:Nuclease SbcCD subunit D n=1 Tax=Clostridium sardiniense TaxID=29369 RepID=A0ABS7KYR6_CLOSR|nr:exonuclease SbcCD subunit D [Clostridium sardiniense]MBY0755899.1 exonuclease SbcCD subunit D [Clostridium sardiniense]MDQ0461371.1 exonuclease SbcD [Clostridium sardiniense]